VYNFEAQFSNSLATLTVLYIYLYNNEFPKLILSFLCCDRFLNPFIFGEYPAIMKKNVGSRLPFFTSSETNLVKGSLDFLGINFYYSFYVKNNAKSLQQKNRDYTADMAVELTRIIISMSFIPILIT
jgi:hypothetical protein